ncbi:hypothetical protein ACM42_29475 [Bradyrhizobium sp. CCBAU 25338]|nr:hypothetical protein [Bradyrhizobium sp. CCBAU 25338]
MRPPKNTSLKLNILYRQQLDELVQASNVETSKFKQSLSCVEKMGIACNVARCSRYRGLRQMTSITQCLLGVRLRQACFFENSLVNDCSKSIYF